MKTTLSVGDVLDRAWSLTKQHGMKLTLAVILYFVVDAALSLLFSPPGYFDAIKANDVAALNEMNTGFNFGTILHVLLAVLFSAGICTAIIRLSRNVQGNIGMHDFAKSPLFYLKFFGLGIVITIVLIIGFICLILPGLYLGARLHWSTCYLIEHPESSIGNAISASWKATKNNSFVLVLILITATFVTISGLVLCCVGVFYTAVIAYFMYGVTYSLLFPATQEPPAAPFARDDNYRLDA